MGAWIEIAWDARGDRLTIVAPLVGAWIEIAENATDYQADTVAPLVGAWIEIFYGCRWIRGTNHVAPLVGAWIEISVSIFDQSNTFPSLPLWERGLKSYSFPGLVMLFTSLPLWERGLK